MRPADKPVRWSLHALERVGGLNIERELAMLTVRSPEFIVEGAHQRRIYMRRYTEPQTGRPMLVRAVVDETPSELTVVTVYVTSKISKYVRGVT